MINGHVTAEERDEMDNNIMATGGVFAALCITGIDASVIKNERGDVTNKIKFNLPFMASAYMITVERIRDDDHV